MDLLKDIKNHSLIIANNQDKLEMLNYFSNNSVFLNLDFFESFNTYSKFNINYTFYLKEKFNIEPYLSDRLRKYFDYIDINKIYDLDKLNLLKNVKKQLVNDLIMKEKKRDYHTLYSVNDSYVPEFLSGEIIDISTKNISNKPVCLYKAKNQKNQIYFVYEKIVELLEKGVSINKIKVLNSSENDDIGLIKLLKDANIPYNLSKRKSLTEYPLMIKLITTLRNDGYLACKKMLEEVKINDITKKIFRVFNSFDSKLIIKNIDVFIHELKKLSIVDLGFKNAITITNFNDVVFNDEEYYILMNYYEEYFPKKYLDNDYLSNNEAKKISYPSSFTLNRHLRASVSSRLNRIDNLILVYPNKVIEEVIPSRITLNREVKEEFYEYFVKEETYLDDFIYLDFAKKRYDFDNYNIISPDLIRLNNVFLNKHKLYIPYFSGITKDTLDVLVNKHNTLSAYKLETFNLCPFKYYLSFLLKLDNFSGNIFTYIGNVIHKALEMKTKEGDYDLDFILDSYDFPEEESYKFLIFKEIITENVNMIEQIVSEFENSSLFKKVYSEHKINIDFDETFTLSGVIDKIMIDKENGYYLIIDYKYGDENYSPNDIDKDYDLQLPFYLMAYQKEEPELKPAGILYQQTSLLKETRGKINNYKMKGLIIDLVSVIERFDPSVTRIQGVSINKDGSLPKRSNSFISPMDLDKLIVKTEERVRDIAKKISLGDFKIMPILTDKNQTTNDSISCQYCPFHTICYSKNKHLGGE
ncbi:MAG: PD-(D/E)XK nuclease family protein [Candidatus Izemoplasmatales bacterium]